MNRWTGASAGVTSNRSDGVLDSRWLYLLAAVPALTDVIEVGGMPQSARQWLTEIFAGALIALLVRRVLRDRARLDAMARSDALTGLLNRRAFDEVVRDECERAGRSGQPLTLVYVDLDHFKRINDESGHDVGDRVLRQLADAVRAVIRTGVDRGFRLGGDEFALLLPGTTADQADAVVRRVQTHCRLVDEIWSGGALGISAGIVELASGEPVRDFIRRADGAMFKCKRARRPPKAGPA